MSAANEDQVEPLRPYSQRELTFLREKLYNNLRLGKMKAVHEECHHFYYVRQNGRKEKDMIQNNTNNVGNCSVCWKRNKTPASQQVQINDLINDYSNYLYNEPNYLTYDLVELEKDFYKWLYADQPKWESHTKSTSLLNKSTE